MGTGNHRMDKADKDFDTINTKVVCECGKEHNEHDIRVCACCGRDVCPDCMQYIGHWCVCKDCVD